MVRSRARLPGQSDEEGQSRSRRTMFHYRSPSSRASRACRSAEPARRPAEGVRPLALRRDAIRPKKPDAARPHAHLRRRAIVRMTIKKEPRETRLLFDRLWEVALFNGLYFYRRRAKKIPPTASAPISPL